MDRGHAQPRWYDYTGTTPDEMKGWGCTGYMIQHYLPGVIEKWNEATAAGKAFAMEVPLLGADGQYRIFLSQVEPLKDAKGRGVQWLSTNTDVNDQRLEEKTRRATEKHLQVVMENMSEGLVISDSNRKLLHWNPAALRMHDVGDAEEVLTNLRCFARLYELSTVEGAVLPIEHWPLARILGASRYLIWSCASGAGERWTRIFSYSAHFAVWEQRTALDYKDITERNCGEALRDPR